MSAFVDTHCHIDTYEEQSQSSFEALWQSMESPEDPQIAAPELMIHVACDPKGFEYARKLSEKHPFIYAAYGIHPEYIETETSEDEYKVTEYLKHPKAVACGEFGLDYHYHSEQRKEQIELFERHLELGLKSQKPLVLHLREADDDAMAILQNAPIKNTNIHVHCFTGSPDFVKRLLSLNTHLFVGFTGIVTFKNAQNVRDAVKEVPLNQLLLETDAPYLAPVPHRGKPAHSGQIPYIAQKIAEIKEKSVDEIYAACRKNTRNCYGI
ncbi:MAG: TatD family hydrolase [Fibrobacteraceae bacterium]|nr:TatD family hydrolase [Fibrobacteraceae bacterium]